MIGRYPLRYGAVIRDPLLLLQVRTRTEQNCSAGQCPVPFPENAQCLVQWFELHWSGEKYMNDGMTLK